MHPRVSAVLITLLCVAAVAVGIVTAAPPVPGTEGNGLTENESATLWSRDSDTYMNESTYRKRYGESRSAVQQLANGTDITFTRPPATAATWTRNDFADLSAGGSNTSVYPRHATLEEGLLIDDAHATIFAVQPSTRAHLEDGETPRYIAPNGTVRGFVDYRVRVPNATGAGNRSVDHELVSDAVEEVRLLKDGEVIARHEGSHTPAIQYQIEEDRRATLTVEADIRVRLKRTVRVNGSNGTAANVSYRSETLTVSDSIPVDVYDPSANLYYAEYPNGDAGLAVFQARPWQGVTVTAGADSRVRGVWRFYTARNTNWDTLVHATRTDRETVASDAIPVFVHAYPSRIGPRAEPVRNGPTITETWGTVQGSPHSTLGENIVVEVVNRSYTTTDGIAVRVDDIDPASITVAGIVRGQNASLIEPEHGFERDVHPSTLTAEVVQQNQTQATIRIELRSATSGEPIVLDERDRATPIDAPRRNGTVIVAGRAVETNESGVALVTVEQPGIYTARYQPGSWISHHTAYVGDTATVRWHPLTTLSGWGGLLIEVGWLLVPFLTMLYAGQRVLRLLSPQSTSSEKP